MHPTPIGIRLCKCKSIYAVNNCDGVYHCDGCGYPLGPNDWRYKYLTKYGLKIASQELWALSAMSEPAMQRQLQRLRFYERIRHLARVNICVGLIISVTLTVSSITSFFDIGSPRLHLMVLAVALPLIAALVGSSLYVNAKLRRSCDD